MIRSKTLKKALSRIIVLLLLSFYFISCSKKDQNNDSNNIYQIDLTDITYHHLLHSGGNVVLSDYNVVIYNTGSGYIAAEAICPVCGNPKISYYNGQWNCEFCSHIWEPGGVPVWPIGATKHLEVYSVTQSGNILTIHK